MDGSALAEEFVALSVNSSGSMPEMGLSSGFDAGSGLKIPGWISRGGSVFDNPSGWMYPS